MRPQDRVVFREAAHDLGLWILVRRTNPESLQYIGEPGYIPKPIECKFKTADINTLGYYLAGLVVSPELFHEAFGPGKRAPAFAIWDEYKQKLRVGLPGSRYEVIEDKERDCYACVTLDGNLIHGDYDLYDIIDPKQPHRNLSSINSVPGQPGMLDSVGANFYRVRDFVNRGIGVPMIRHGGEAQFQDHTEQAIDAFGPDGEDVTILNEYSVRGWYEGRFGGRRNINLPK